MPKTGAASPPASTGYVADKLASKGSSGVSKPTALAPQVDPAMATSTIGQALIECSGVANKAAATAGKALGLPLTDPQIQAASVQALAECKTQAVSEGAGGGSTGGMQSLAMSSCVPDNSSGCTSGDQVHCVKDEVRAVIRQVFTVPTSSALEVYTDGLLPLAGADTVLYLLRCDTASCSRGSFVGIDDDGNAPPIGSRASRVSVTAPVTGTYMAIVMAYSGATQGSAKLHAVQASQSLLTPAQEQLLPFGGWNISCKDLRTDDALYVAKNPTGISSTAEPDYHDSTVAIFSSSSLHCFADFGGCGQFQFADDTYYGAPGMTLATRVAVDPSLGNPSEARVLIAPYDSGSTLRSRFLHGRLHQSLGGAWTGEAQRDLDQDGLSHEIESELHTCDVPSTWDKSTQAALDTGVDLGIVGRNCATFSTLVDEWAVAANPALSCPGNSACWRSQDSDNDGLADGYEVFAAPIQCEHEPTGPYRDAGSCVQLGIASACAPGSWCLTEPLPARAGVDTSLPSGPNPTVFDVYLEQDYYEKHAANTAYSEPNGQHRLASAVQLGLLSSIFGTMPNRCWDGQATTSACPTPEDWRYRVALHIFHGAGSTVGDDRFQENLPTSSGSRFARSHWFARFGDGPLLGPAFRYGSLGRFGLTWHGSSGSGDTDLPSRRLVWYGDSQTDVPGAANFAHEVGHSLTLDHPHGGGLACPAVTDPPTPDPDLTCRYNAPPSTGGLSCPDVRSAQLPVASLMSYDYLFGRGMRPLSNITPNWTTSTFSLCSLTNLRFSKGLNPDLLEIALKERMVPGVDAPEWQLAKLAQDLFCFDGFNDGINTASQFSFYDASLTDPSRGGPGFDGSDYLFNWNSNQTQVAESGSYAYDASGGRTQVNNPVCREDRLEDVNEWGRVFSGSKNILSNTPDRQMCLYGDTFNGTDAVGNGFFGDFCGWNEPLVVANMTASATVYPYRGCVVDSTGNTTDCTMGANACRRDTCASGGSCRISANCDSADGTCGCGGDGDCYSGQCIAGKCVTAWGGCNCGADSDCPGGTCDGGTGAEACNVTRDAENSFAVTVDPLNSNEPQPLRQSAVFNGVSASIQQPSSANSRLESLTGTYENGFTWMLDLRHDGFDGETGQTILHSAAFNLTKTVDGLMVTLDNGQTVLSYPPHGGDALQRGRWYRIIWSVKLGANGGAGENFIWVRPWNPQTGGYMDGLNALNCVRRVAAGSLASPGTVWMGHDASTDTSRFFKGRLDNVSLVNYVHVERPALCTDQP